MHFFMDPLHNCLSQLGTTLQCPKAVSRHRLTDSPSEAVARIEQEERAPPLDRKNRKRGEGE